MDYNKYRYEKQKKQKKKKKKQRESNKDIKEYRLSPVIDIHDFNARKKNANEYLLKGHKIKENDLNIMKNYYSSLGFGIVSNWLRNDMSDDIRSAVVRLMDIKKGMLKEMIDRCEEA